MQVTIYKFKTYDSATGTYVFPKRRATRKTIERNKQAELLKGTGTEVPESAINPDGYEIIDAREAVLFH